MKPPLKLFVVAAITIIILILICKQRCYFCKNFNNISQLNTEIDIDNRLTLDNNTTYWEDLRSAIQDGILKSVMELVPDTIGIADKDPETLLTPLDMAVRVRTNSIQHESVCRYIENLNTSVLLTNQIEKQDDVDKEQAEAETRYIGQT